MKRLLTVLLLIAGLTTQCHAQNRRPMRVHDPAIGKDGETYYLFSTGRGIGIRRSNDLVQWDRVGYVLDQLPDWATELIPKARGAWAPDIAYFNNRYHLYYSVSTFGSRTSCIGLATSPTLDPDSPDYQWTDRGLVVQSNDQTIFNAIDPNVFIDQQKNAWLSFGSYFGGLQMVKLDSSTGKPVTDPVTIAAHPSRVVEAPFVIEHQGYYYLFVSYDVCCRGVESTYKLKVGRSKSLLGPFVDHEGTPMTKGGGTLLLSSHDHIHGPGHNCIFEHEGREYVGHHFYDAQFRGLSRLQIRPLLWPQQESPETNWPVVGEPGVIDAQQPQTKAQGKYHFHLNYEKAGQIELTAEHQLITPQGSGTWSQKGQSLILQLPTASAQNEPTQIHCVLSRDSDWFIGRDQQGRLWRGTRMDE